MTLLDTSDLDRWIGIPFTGGDIVEDIHVNDIRRWAQAMQNPYPLHYDRAWARESRFGDIVAAPSFTVNTTWGHGAEPSIQGVVPGTHMLFGGDEWWFYGPRVRAGDVVRCEKMLFDYSQAETKFAGPTIFSRGDTTYVNQDGELIAKQRSTSIRYLAEEAAKRMKEGEAAEPEWSDAQIHEIEEEKMDYYKSFLDLGHDRRLIARVGEKLPRRPIGPHTVQSFTTEWRSCLFTVWGATNYDYLGTESTTEKAGWLPEMTKDFEGGQVDPARTDGLYLGPSRGHTIPRYAKLIGMPRGYGYGASMGAWVLDYVSNWGGEWSELQHSEMKFRAPALTGDLTYLDGEITALDYEHASGRPRVTIRVTMTNQLGAVMATGDVETLLPSESAPAAG
ncbi:MAG: MaoC family dehydratase N-terminal domain-containing protein [Myxococcales bacterium]|nr:MaoC family dehydratase N-terminal domain-containing protein [Myxococcales bacterium]